jgi:hypothetical protein
MILNYVVCQSLANANLLTVYHRSINILTAYEEISQYRYLLVSLYSHFLSPSTSTVPPFSSPLSTGILEFNSRLASAHWRSTSLFSSSGFRAVFNPKYPIPEVPNFHVEPSFRHFFSVQFAL